MSGKKRPAPSPSGATAADSSPPDNRPFTQPSPPYTEIVPLSPSIDPNLSPFTLSSPNHNLLLTLLTQSHHTPHPWIKCSKCGKWRKLPPTLSGLSPMLPAFPLTLSALASLSSPFLPYPFICSANHWDIDRQVCGAIQDYQDLVYEWKQVPLKFVRAVPRCDFYIALAHFLRVKGVAITEYPCIYGKSIDLFALYSIVYQAGGDEAVTRRGQWLQVYELLKLPSQGVYADIDYLAEIYRSYFFEWQAPQSIDFSQPQINGQKEEGEVGEEKRRDGGKGEEKKGGEEQGEREKNKGETEDEGEQRKKRKVDVVVEGEEGEQDVLVKEGQASTDGVAADVDKNGHNG